MWKALTSDVRHFVETIKRESAGLMEAIHDDAPSEPPVATGSSEPSLPTAHLTNFFASLAAHWAEDEYSNGDEVSERRVREQLEVVLDAATRAGDEGVSNLHRTIQLLQRRLVLQQWEQQRSPSGVGGAGGVSSCVLTKKEMYRKQKESQLLEIRLLQQDSHTYFDAFTAEELECIRKGAFYEEMRGASAALFEGSAAGESAALPPPFRVDNDLVYVYGSGIFISEPVKECPAQLLPGATITTASISSHHVDPNAETVGEFPWSKDENLQRELLAVCEDIQERLLATSSLVKYQWDRYVRAVSVSLARQQQEGEIRIAGDSLTRGETASSAAAEPAVVLGEDSMEGLGDRAGEPGAVKEVPAQPMPSDRHDVNGDARESSSQSPPRPPIAGDASESPLPSPMPLAEKESGSLPAPARSTSKAKVIALSQRLFYFRYFVRLFMLRCRQREVLRSATAALLDAKEDRAFDVSDSDSLSTASSFNDLERMVVDTANEAFTSVYEGLNRVVGNVAPVFSALFTGVGGEEEEEGGGVASATSRTPSPAPLHVDGGGEMPQDGHNEKKTGEDRQPLVSEAAGAAMAESEKVSPASCRSSTMLQEDDLFNREKSAAEGAQ